MCEALHKHTKTYIHRCNSGAGSLKGLCGCQIGSLAGWLAGWLTDCLVVWLAGRLANWLVGLAV